ncbi:Aromatic prenyltransferase, DMATS type [Penicillium expansum]|uniref:Tryptophan dimethylallyltransferase cnsF n=1 Tax=Penicillium expansum TaxID=27334 RepID=CNSF_PENEN|nr:Aromatic prenyltransferase, DMATS type [Penicillium expansum]A0A0A2JWD0.1 RecName: Full=Tryptophan dimethylallyltransferase cnsF; AltName: Full=4-dimethylallyltryptophan synthase; Short=DMATS; AltName: Full=All-trans-hexaprenyl-diphosphate synthase; AltName: Full=Communesin biosynthesis cluster protein F; AltName: Full=L-tryptophan dimethylallyl transferase [Penicillium expansum]KGO40475.1 Aromatic prenyltransferase, DMATS type [Penicillium expansum]KGO50067.1 Aromatic prenyltransferase, DMAT
MGTHDMSPNASHSYIYRVLSDILEFPDNEQRMWWHSVAPMFAEMLRACGYDIHEQYKILGIWKKAVIPFLGCYPTNDGPRWLSILTRYGTPFELSLNCSHRLVRYTFEPINAATGTDKDPFNTQAIWESLSQLRRLNGDVDTELFNHFKANLTVDNAESAHLVESNLAGSKIRTQNKLALDLQNGSFVVKAYFYPTLKSAATGRSITDLMLSSVRQQVQKWSPTLAQPLSVLEEYIEARGPDSTASPRLLSCDLINPERARTKIYLLERQVSIEAMEDLWTLGGRRKSDSALAALDIIREIWSLIQLPPCLASYPSGYLPLGTVPDEQLPLMVNYTLRPDDPMPEPQVYFTTFGQNDLHVTNALTAFFERQGWTELAESYKENLRAYYPHADQETANYIHAYVSFSYRKGVSYMSVYLQTLETGDWPITYSPKRQYLCNEHPIHLKELAKACA